jgi:hypothetical protein
VNTSSASDRVGRPWSLPRLPREHGFWAILVVVVSSALTRATHFARAGLAAAGVVVFAVMVGSMLGRRIRRSAALQVASAAALSLCGVPVQLAAGSSLLSSTIDAGTWVAVFMACALGVRACFARGTRKKTPDPTRLALASILFPLGVAVVFAQLSMRAQAVATLVAGAGLTAVALYRPTSKQLKPVGISLATIAVLAAVALRVL